MARCSSSVSLFGGRMCSYGSGNHTEATMRMEAVPGIFFTSPFTAWLLVRNGTSSKRSLPVRTFVDLAAEIDDLFVVLTLVQNVRVWIEELAEVMFAVFVAQQTTTAFLRIRRKRKRNLADRTQNTNDHVDVANVKHWHY